MLVPGIQSSLLISVLSSLSMLRSLEDSRTSGTRFFLMKTHLFGTACLLLLATRICMAQSQPGEGQELPTHGPFFVAASCPDFIFGARPTDQEGKHNAYDLWVQMAGERGEYRVAPTIFPDRETTTLDASCTPAGIISPDARWVAQIGRAHV